MVIFSKRVVLIICIELVVAMLSLAAGHGRLEDQLAWPIGMQLLFLLFAVGVMMAIMVWTHLALVSIGYNSHYGTRIH